MGHKIEVLQIFISLSLSFSLSLTLKHTHTHTKGNKPSQLSILPYLKYMTIKPMGRGPGKTVQSFQQRLSSAMQLDDFDQHVGQAKHGNQVPNPRKIHRKVTGVRQAREEGLPVRLTKWLFPKREN